MRFAIKLGFFFFLILVICQNCFNKKEAQCEDLLKNYKIKNVTFKECKKGNYFQSKALVAKYTVNGRDALIVELELREKFKMAPLKYRCCLWENESLDDANDSKIIVEMTSDETYIKDRNKWNEIEYFHVMVFSLLEEV